MDLAIRRFRQQSGLTLKDMATKTGISLSYISQIERGDRPIKIDQIRAFADALGVPPSTLMVDAAVSAIPVSGSFMGGHVNSLNDGTQIVCPPLMPPTGLTAIRIEDGAMEPFYQVGGAIIYEVRGAQRPEPGDMYVAQFGRSNRHICQIKMGSGPGLMNLLDPLQRQVPMFDVKVRSLHRVTLYLPPRFCQYITHGAESASEDGLEVIDDAGRKAV